ncbi:MAG: hypothetical protein OHK0015_38760 [Chloroflexi bacterium OHK40]
MDVTRSSQRRSSAVARGIFGELNERLAQLIAVLITTSVFGALAYGLNALFTTMGQ